MQIATNTNVSSSSVGRATRNQALQQAQQQAKGIAAHPGMRQDIAHQSTAAPRANQLGLDRPSMGTDPQAATQSSRVRQTAAAAGVKRGLDGASQMAKGSTSWLSSGGTFEDLAAKFDRDKMKQDIKKDGVGGSTGVNHSATTKSASEPSPSASAQGGRAAARAGER